MGTADKVCAVALAIRERAERRRCAVQDVSFILLELGGAFSAAIAVDGGRIVDGVGGSSGPLGMRAAGALDGEVAFLAGGVSKKLVFSGGAAAVAGLPAASRRGSRILTSPAARVAWEAYMESAAKAVSALAVAVPQAHEVVLSGRSARSRACVMSSRIGCAASWTASRSTRSRGSSHGQSGRAGRGAHRRRSERGCGEGACRTPGHPRRRHRARSSVSGREEPAHESASVNVMFGSGVPCRRSPSAERRTPNAERRTGDLNMNVERTRTRRSESRPRRRLDASRGRVRRQGRLRGHRDRRVRRSRSASRSQEPCAATRRSRTVHRASCRGSVREIDADAVAYLSPFENHTRAVDALASGPSTLRTGPSTALTAGRALWGNPPDVIRRVRDPFLLAGLLRRRGLLPFHSRAWTFRPISPARKNGW